MSSEATSTVVVPMPHMGVSVEEGTVIEWLVAVGDEVKAEDPLCAIATDKVDTEVLAPADGVLARIIVEVDGTVAVGAPLAEMAVGADADAAAPEAAGAVGTDSADATQGGEGVAGASSEDGPSRRVSGESAPTALTGSGATGPHQDAELAARAAAGRDEFGRFDPKAAAEAVLSFVGGSNGSGALASPVAKRMAAKHGIDLGAVKGSGRRGRIRKADVERAIANPPAGGPKSRDIGDKSAHRPLDLGSDGLPVGYAGIPHEVVRTTRVRQAIAEHMSRSRQTAAHMTTEVDVDLAAVVRARTELNATRVEAGEAKLSYLPFIARAACAALTEHPDLNATFLGERMIRWGEVNLGVAVDTPEGLLVPVVRGCERLTAPAIGAAIADLAERARTRKLVPDDLAGGTFTLSNPGSVGAVSAPAIINQPQVAILGVPTIQRRPWVVTDEHGTEAIAIRSILRVAVTFDHRAVDGAGATRFAVAVKEHLEAWAPEAYG
ncbi:MAG: 2-oxo acid dehydrogenase subunit E2 [Thermoleophilia bacterium]|nr:2-oxo acid dehydrogenase subunit E2 [Thermoleophilia bacterium]